MGQMGIQEQEFDYDMKRNALFCMENEDGEIISRNYPRQMKTPQVGSTHLLVLKTLKVVLRSFPGLGYGTDNAKVHVYYRFIPS